MSDSSFEDDEDASTRAIFRTRSPCPSTNSIFTTKTTKTGHSLGGFPSHETENSDEEFESETQSIEKSAKVLFTVDDVKNI